MQRLAEMGIGFDELANVVGIRPIYGQRPELLSRAVKSVDVEMLGYAGFLG